MTEFLNDLRVMAAARLLQLLAAVLPQRYVGAREALQAVIIVLAAELTVEVELEERDR